MWTISDFSGLENLSGWNTHSGLACSTCNLDAKHHQLKDGKKWCFMGHHGFLNQGHQYRLDQNSFDGQFKGRDPPKKLSRTDILRQQSNVHVSFGNISTITAKKTRNGQDADEDDSHWKKKSVFFDLPYWEDQMLRYNLDVMHIEKNVCDNVSERRASPSSSVQEQSFAAVFRLTEELRSSPPSESRALSSFTGGQFLSKRTAGRAPTHPTATPTVMVHLTVHLVDKVNLGGPVHYRYLGRLKQYVCNRAQPEGSIAEGYLSKKILTFCSRYLDNIETRINRPGRVDDQPVDVTHNLGETLFLAIEKALGTVSHFELTPMKKHQAHRHVLVNCEAVVVCSNGKYASFKRNEVACMQFHDSGKTLAYNVNEYKFRTITKEDGLKTQNSGVYVSSNTRSYARMHDNRVAVGSVSKGIKQDHLGLTSVNFSRPIHTGNREDNEPYILASEAQLVYYVNDEVAKEWSVVVHPELNISAEGDIEDLQLTREDDIEDPKENASENIDDVA
ncbi:uncharacterized protein [Arachis hypogaea]|uniref:uncharacterized protein n=1 Tax=Arachis hypogaea TaxID=3818 RepID=UPI000DEC7E88|nr:uncharacterized protein LOC112775043 [Arachis hypogaea]